MTSQQHADHLLRIYQQRRDLPPRQRLADLKEQDEYERDLDVIRKVLAS